MGGSNHEVTELLRAWSNGDVGARDRLVPIVYHELRRRAAAQLRRERPGHTLQPTALVHEVYLRLIDQHSAVWQDRAQFFRVASQMMRRILVDRARAHRMTKRSGQWSRVILDDAIAVAHSADVDVLDLDSALTRLATTRRAQESDRRAPVLHRAIARGDRPRPRRLACHRRERLAGGSRVALQGTVRQASES